MVKGHLGCDTTCLCCFWISQSISRLLLNKNIVYSRVWFHCYVCAYLYILRKVNLINQWTCQTKDTRNYLGSMQLLSIGEQLGGSR